MKVTPIRKMSKKARKEIHAARRGSWNGLSPVTRVARDRRVYDRNRRKREELRASDD